MAELLNIPLLPVVLTLGAYQVGLLLQRKLHTPLCNPIAIAVALVLAFLGVTGMELPEYQAGAASLSWLMTPATVCLAIPMYEQLRILRKNLPGILAGVCAGAVSCLILVMVFGWLCHFQRELTLSLLPKSVTTAFGVPLSNLIGGHGSITTAAIILSGIIANILGPTFCRLFRLEGEIAQGVGFGTAGHVIATTRAGELSPLTGAVSSLSLVIAGLLTAVLLPLVTAFV